MSADMAKHETQEPESLLRVVDQWSSNLSRIGSIAFSESDLFEEEVRDGLSKLSGLAKASEAKLVEEMEGKTTLDDVAFTRIRRYLMTSFPANALDHLAKFDSAGTYKGPSFISTGKLGDLSPISLIPLDRLLKSLRDSDVQSVEADDKS